MSVSEFYRSYFDEEHDLIRRYSFGQHGVGITPHGFTLSLPVRDEHSAEDFLSMIGSNRLASGMAGGAVGGGLAMNQFAANAPILRAEYKQSVENMAAEIARRLQAGESKESVARWANAERNRIIGRVRAQSGIAARTVFEIRDIWKYGRGSRSWDNIYRRKKGNYDAILESANESNKRVNDSIKKGANYLRHGGRIVLVVGVTATAARIWNASEQDMPRVIAEEMGAIIGGAAGGYLGAKVAMGVCVAFGVGTAGWGLLACGIIGGGIGGIAGGYGGSKLSGAAADGWYYSDANTPANQLENITLEIPVERLHQCIPPYRCDVYFD